VHEHGGLALPRTGQHDPPGEPLEGPLEDVLGGPVLEVVGELVDVRGEEGKRAHERETYQRKKIGLCPINPVGIPG
jgi:hypothetical protein